MSNDFVLIDPQGKYPACGLRHVDRLAKQLVELLPDACLERTRDAFEIAFGGEEGVVLLVTKEAIEFRLPTVEWSGGAFAPVATSRLWKRVSAEKLGIIGGVDTTVFFSILAAARKKRASEFKTCRFCGRRVPREHRHDERTCHGCAEQHLGVVH